MVSFNYSVTAWWDNDDVTIYSLRAFVLHTLKTDRREFSKAWRHHGNGLLQRYVREGSSREMRIHIWHPDLLINGMEQSGQIHDHRFDLQSTVLIGSIRHSELALSIDPAGEWMRYSVVNARQGVTPEPIPDPSGVRYSATFKHHRFPPRMTYTFPRRYFHRSQVDEPAVTLVIKSDADGDPAWILGPHDAPPTMAHGFKQQIPHAKMYEYVTLAIDALEGTL